MPMSATICNGCSIASDGPSGVGRRLADTSLGRKPSFQGGVALSVAGQTIAFPITPDLIRGLSRCGQKRPVLRWWK